jgi:hypothetical protein
MGVNIPIHRSLHNDAETSRIIRRLLASLPAASFEMEAFSRLAGIVASRRIPTAAVECTSRPRLLINPDFVAKYCARDEHLFLLVMHELWHILLAHTSLYSRVTKAHNIAFDAIINSTLSRLFSTAPYQGFFDVLNPADQFPHMLLRPPEGWPDKPLYRDDVGPVGTARVMRQLYPPGGNNLVHPHYSEILALIRQDMKDRGIPENVILLGDHDGKPDYDAPFLGDMMNEMLERWPSHVLDYLPNQTGSPWRINRQPTVQLVRQTFASILRRVCDAANQQQYLRQRTPLPTPGGRGVLPNAADRLRPARRQLGIESLLWEQATPRNTRTMMPHAASFIYLDVSGSMGSMLPYLVDLLLPFMARGQAQVYQFSTCVAPLSLHDLKQNQLHTSGGTAIRCVTEHLMEHLRRVRRVLILTDGFTGHPAPDHLQRLQEAQTRVHVVLPAESHNQRDLSALAASMTILPPLH